MSALFLWLVSIGASQPLLVPGGFTDPAVAVHYNDNAAASFGDTAADLGTKLFLAASGTHQLQMWLTKFPIHTFTSSTALLNNDQSTPATTTIYVKVTAGNSVTLYWGDGASVVLTADGALHVYTHDYSAGTYTVAVGGDIAGITEWRSYSQSFLSGDVGRFSVLTSLLTLHLYGASVSGDVSALSSLTSLTYLNLRSTSVSGNISGLAGMTSLTYLNLGSASVSGDIGDLNGLTSLTYLRLDGTSLSYGSVALPPWAGAVILVQSAGLDSTEVDNFLIDLASGVGANGSLDISGTNAARTSASDAAKATLLAAGWSVTVNE